MLREDKFLPGRPPSEWLSSPAPGAPGAPTIPPSGDPVSPWPPAGGPIQGDTLRRGGVASATGVLLALMLVTSVVGWNAVETRITETTVDGVVQRSSEIVSFPFWLILAPIIGFVVALVTFFKPAIARFTAPVYALAQGLFVGAISKVYETQFEGIVAQAIGLTIGVFVLMLVLYATGRIRVTDKFRLYVIAATGGIFLVYLASFVLSLIGAEVPFIHESGPIGIGFSLLVVGIASMNLALDFDFVDRAEAAGAPRHMEWFAALSLMVTLIWLYLEILRLLAKLRDR